MNGTKRVLLRDLLIFQVKLLLDGMKDITLSPLAIVAVGVDMLAPGERVGHRFYAVMRLGERFDRWLNLFGEADRARAERGGLFAESRAGSDSLLGRIEEMVLGRAETEAESARTRA
jgi:hypothetical protein